MTSDRALAADVEAIVDLIAADQIGAERDGGDLAPYQPGVRGHRCRPGPAAGGRDRLAGAVVGTLQMTFIPGLARRGALRAQIEAVRIHPGLRGRGVGNALLTWAIDEARRRDCALVQLTSDKRRSEAHRFYGRLGFAASHDGFKLRL